MANYATLKTAIQNVVKTNGNNEITGALLQQSLLAMVNSLGADYQFVGIAQETTNPGAPDQNVFYIAGPGTYPNFNSATIPDGRLGVMKYNGSWTTETAIVGKNYDDAIRTILGIIGEPITITLTETWTDFQLPYTIPAGTKIISLNSQSQVNGRTNANDPTFQTIATGTITDRPINYIRSGSTGTVAIQIDGLVYRSTQDLPDGSVTTPKLADKAVTPTKTNFDIFIDTTGDTDYSGTIAELYIVVPIISGSTICCKFYNNSFYVRLKTGSSITSDTWVSITDMRQWTNKTVYKLLCTTASASLGVNVGDTIGYVVFKDVAKFRSLLNTSAGCGVANDWVRDMTNAPIIVSSLGDTPIADGSVTTPKLADKAVTPTKTNFDIFIDTTGDTDYSGTIAELYIVVPIISGSTICCKFYNNSFYVRLKTGSSITSDTWVSITDMRQWTNKTVYKLLCTTASASLGVNVGDTIGYVVFKDVAKFRSLLNTSAGCGVANDWVRDMTNAPIIVSSLGDTPIADGSVTTPKLADWAVTPEKMADKFIRVANNYDIRGCIAELYFKYDAVVFDDAGGYTNIAAKGYNNNLVVRSLKNSSNYGWTCYLPLSGKTNGVVYELVVTTAGANTNYGVGDTVGYVVFKNISGVTYEGGNPYNIIRENAIQLCYSPMIYAYLRTQNIDVQGAILFPELRLPTDIYIVSGDSLMIFYKSIIKTYNPNICGIRVVCSVGKAYTDYYLLQTTATGNYNAEFSIVDNDNNIISTKNVAIHVIAAMSSPASNKNVLVFGASATANGELAGELKRRLTETSGDGTTQNPTGLGLNNISFVGRKTGTQVNVHQEATGGWSWQDYAGTGRPAYRFNVTGVNQLNIGDTYTQNGVVLTITEINVTGGAGNIRCIYSGTNAISASGTLTRQSGSGDATITYTSFESESYNPFWNENKSGGAGLDFINYANLYCNGAIDVMISHCGLNDMNQYTPATMSQLFTNYVKPFIRAYHTDFPNGKFIISTLPLPSPTGGMGANYGASSNWAWLITALKLWAFAVEAEKMCKESEFSSFVYLADDVPVFDCVHSYPYEMAYVNNRSTVQEERGTNGVHPTNVGTYQVSDAIYMTFNRLGL